MINEKNPKRKSKQKGILVLLTYKKSNLES